MKLYQYQIVQSDKQLCFLACEGYVYVEVDRAFNFALISNVIAKLARNKWKLISLVAKTTCPCSKSM